MKHISKAEDMPNMLPHEIINQGYSLSGDALSKFHKDLTEDSLELEGEVELLEVSNQELTDENECLEGKVEEMRKEIDLLNDKIEELESDR